LRKENIIVGLDVGTTKVCIVVGRLIKNELEFCGVSSCTSTGVRKGVIVDVESTAESIKRAVKSAEDLAGVEINAVHVGISGGHIKGFTSCGAVAVKRREVTAADVGQAIDSAKASYVPLDREILHVIPTGYALDGQNGIREPEGMTGERLEAKVHIVTAAVTSVRNLLRCCEKAGVQAVDIVFEPLASAEAILTNDEKEIGVVVADVGGGTTDIILFKDGWMRNSSVLAVGGNHFTNDIAVGLRISVAEAERIKKRFGTAGAIIVKYSEEIESAETEKAQKITHGRLNEIIMPRAEELLEMVRKNIAPRYGHNIAAAGVVLTGGGALLGGFPRMAEDILGMPVRIGFPRDIKGCRDIANNPMYSTGAGLVRYAVNENYPGMLCPEACTGIFEKMKDWVKGIFI
jgi:cell division protein FtsA